MKRVCVFVDGENFRHTLLDLFPDFDSREYLPKKTPWDKLFDWFVAKTICDDGFERVRTYWYVIAMLDCYPDRLPGREASTEKLRQFLRPWDEARERLKALDDDPDKHFLEVTELVAEVERRRAAMRKRFQYWRSRQERIASQGSRIEWRRAGAITFNAFDKKLGSEKAVDVKLATDLITLRGIYDVAIIVSGDQDYVPAVQVVKDSGKRVVNVVFRNRAGRLLPGGAKRLNELTDECVEIRHDDIKPFIFPPT
ncbi:MAG: NYN domain-containing protein [Planctomycetes bacterium]|nr:NYN domain-containing protein [Planctomycetota bacterium]